ncbi:hypothetical protein AB0K09_28135 [Streptomyces sp. NPDC049577]|uniref:hypothetical protein n=1 Tax=Streptomyces sp. NPDC049577 TaxID=3155153 RepID=UPI003416084A
MPPPLVATLDIYSTDPNAYRTFINTIRARITVIQGDPIDVSTTPGSARRVNMLRLRQNHRRDREPADHGAVTGGSC